MQLAHGHSNAQWLGRTGHNALYSVMAGRGHVRLAGVLLRAVVDALRRRHPQLLLKLTDLIEQREGLALLSWLRPSRSSTVGQTARLHEAHAAGPWGSSLTTSNVNPKALNPPRRVHDHGPWLGGAKPLP